MAEVTSGSFTTTGYSDPGQPDRLVFSWSLKSQDIVNCTSTITFSVYGAGGSSSGRWTKLKSASATVAGKSYSYSNQTSAEITLYNGTVVFSGDVVVQHNTSTGAGSFSASVSSALYYTTTNNSGSGSWTLPTIARASSISSISNDSMVINGSNALTVNISRKNSTFTHNVKFTFGSKTYTATNQGTSCKYTIPLAWISEFGSGGSGSKTGSVTVTTYNGSTIIGSAVSSAFTLKCPSASTISSSTSSITCNGSNTIEVGISRSIGSFKHKVTWKFGSNSKVTESVDTSTSYAIPTSWLSAIASANSGTGTVTVETYYGTQKIGSTVSKSFTLNVPSYTPSLTGVAASVVQPSNMSDWTIYVQNKSGVKFTFNDASGAYSSTIKKYEVSINGQTYSSTSNIVTVSTLVLSGTIPYKATITDSRNKSTSVTGNISVEALVFPSYVSSSIYRYNGTEKDDEGTQIYFKFKYSYESYSGKNTITSNIYIKEQTASSYTNYGSFTNDAEKIINTKKFLMEKSYDVKVIVTDTLGGTLSYEINIPTSYAAIDVNDKGNGIGLLKMSSMEGHVEIGGYVDIDEDLIVKGSAQIGGFQYASYSFGSSNHDGNVWHFLGLLTSNGDNTNTIIDVYSGNGYNGQDTQNTHIKIIVKDGWQSTLSADTSFGITYEVYGNDGNVLVEGRATAHNEIAIWIKFPWKYYNGQYEVYGDYALWVPIDTVQTEDPSDGSVQSCVRKYPILDKSYLPLTGGTVTGTLVLSKTTDASGTANNSPCLIVGGPVTGTHLEFDGNEIMAKSDGTTPSNLYLNSDGGIVTIGTGGLTANGESTFNANATFNKDVGISTLWVTNKSGFSGTATFSGELIPQYAIKLISNNELILNGKNGNCWFGYNVRSGYDKITYWDFGNGAQSYGTCRATAFTQSSDAKLKDDLNDISKAKDFILGLKAYDYKFINGHRRHMGFVAQGVRDLCNELEMGDMAIYAAALRDKETGKPDLYFDETADDKELSWSLNYSEFIAPMVVTIQEQQKEIDKLKELIEKLVR